MVREFLLLHGAHHDLAFLIVQRLEHERLQQASHNPVLLVLRFLDDTGFEVLWGLGR
jgi:hypothetical protein